ncbi:MAG: sporulation protein YunB [Oscillospiraceae bacterium]|nr:sporulation protein YunB [Oscillospiraceae bacterium]
MRLGIKKRLPVRGWIIVLLLALAIAVFASAIARRMMPAFVSQAHSFANTMVTDVIENAVNETLASGEYSETAKVHENGSITTVEADTVTINKLKSELTVKIQNDIAAQCDTKILVPLLSASGIALLSGVGPKIPISIYPAPIVNTNYTESFESAGINQVRHTMAINVDVQMNYAGYMLNETETVNTDVPVIDSIITGGVPSYYGAGQISVPAE